MTQTPDHASRGHAEFSPSSLKYVAACAGFQGKNGESAASAMGTRIHEALEIRDPSALQSEEEVEIYDQICEMEREFMSNFHAEGAIEENEIQVTVELHGTKTWGTCDRFIRFGNRAVMADYKTGISIIDPPEKNWQAKAYTLGAFQRYPEIEEITFVFYVPKHNASLSHTFTRDDMDVLKAELSRVIRAGETVRPKWLYGTPKIDECRPSQYCRFCTHEEYCPALGGLVTEVAKKLEPSLSDIDIENTDDPAHLEELFNIAKIVSNWADRIKAKTVAAAKDGVQFPSIRLKSMGATRKITDNITLKSIANHYGVTDDELLKVASIPLGNLTKAITAKGDKKVWKKISEEFVDACENAGIIETSDTRYTIQ